MAVRLHPYRRQVSHMPTSQTRSTLISGILHVAAIVLIVVTTRVATPPSAVLHPVFLVPHDIAAYVAATPTNRDGGNGGGKHDLTPPTQGRLPRAATHQFALPVAVYRNLNPVLPMEPTILANSDVAFPTINLAQFGDPNAPPGRPSGGPGGGGGIGGGDGTGVGNGRGSSWGGDGEGPGISGRSGTRGGITAPVLLWKSEPEYSDEARKAKLQGTVVLYIEVDPRGQVGNIRVRQSLGLGLDERAIAAVAKWKFRPGYLNGKPVATGAMVEVNFRLL